MQRQVFLDELIYFTNSIQGDGAGQSGSLAASLVGDTHPHQIPTSTLLSAKNEFIEPLSFVAQT